jgi:peptidoglycan/LPS O-acetylase OafA/YrhL
MAGTTTRANEKDGLPAGAPARTRPAGKSGLKYRADIDGLRGVAVLSVFAYHLGLTRFAGGFVGVDVFFVISGYLISSILITEIEASRFTIAGFYERRIRRIFPALFAVMALTSIASVIFFLPDELVDYAKSLVAVTGFASNLFYAWHSGLYYFSPTPKPLVHTWSLAVEEQFYLSFPLFLMAVRRWFPRHLRAAVALLFVASFVTCCVVVLRNREAAYMLPYTRAWELLMGTLLSLKMLPALRSPLVRNAATLCGIGMILGPVLFYSHATLFPGAWALVPCGGAVLIIWAGEAGGSLVGAALSLRPLVFVGLISYSLYLWHVCILRFQRIDLLAGLGGVDIAGRWPGLSLHRLNLLVVIVPSFALAILSWKFVEQPFRSGSLRMKGRRLFAAAGGATAVSMGVAFWLIAAHGLPGRFPRQAQAVMSAIDPQQEARAMRTGTCFLLSTDVFEKFDRNTCLHADPDRKNYLLLGDGHAAMLYPALAKELRGARVMQASLANCVPAMRPLGSNDCRKMMAYIFEQYLPAHPVQAVLLAGGWQRENLSSLAGVIAWARQHQVAVIVFGPLPQYDAPLPRLLAYSIAWKRPALPDRHEYVYSKLLDAEMQTLAATSWHVPYISLYDAICRGDDCLEYADPEHTLPLMSGDNELSTPGADLVVQRLIDTGRLD